MGSSLFNSMGRQTQNPIGGQFQQFMGQMQGKNPQEMINQMLTSGPALTAAAQRYSAAGAADRADAQRHEKYVWILKCGRI